ncbi:hypothetical protein DFJ74DRAFT_705296 [Hyaloraphidium curvatum]|nr:hypothetical protein DFJ74DRAFT_705296 [Hyaloraphidium curvatum]
MAPGDVVLIVGASTGIGKALSERCALNGYKVMMASRSLDKGLQNKADLIAKCGAGSENLIEFCKADVAERADMKRLWDETIARFGTCHHLILNAWSSANPEPEKGGHWWDMVDAEQDYWEKDIYTGLTGQMVIMRYALTHWRRQNMEGNIIWTGSGVAFPGVTRTNYIYPVVKMAMIKMAEVFDLSVRSPGYKGPKIRMNVVAPGIVYIESRGPTLEEATRRYGGAERLKRGGGWTPMNVLLDAYIFLMENKDISGQTLQVAGERGNVRIYKPNTRHPVFDLKTGKAKL